MTMLCITPGPDSGITVTEVSTLAACPTGYIAQPPSHYADNVMMSLSYDNANQLLGATAQLFVLAFILREIRRFIQNR